MHQDKIDNLWHAVFGNGRPGLVARMDRLESSLHTGIAILRWQIGIMVAIAIPLFGWFFSQILK